MEKTDVQSDFSKGSMAGNILRLAIPITFAQLVNLLYNIIDRIYIGHIGEDASLALGGVGLTFPIITMITAFSNLFGMGGSPLFSISRGQKNPEKARVIMGNSFFMLVLTGVLLTILGLIFKEPLLYLFGASEETFRYADSYITIYLLGTVFVMITLGMNRFINAQGFAKKGMLTVLIGAVLNILLDPLFIFGLDMGVSGAAMATILSQSVSAVWVLSFLFGKKAILNITKESMKIKPKLLLEICSLGLSGFVMEATNGIVQIACNTALFAFGGDLYVSVMTIIISLREVITIPVNGLTSAAQPVLGYNYGARMYERVKKGIRFVSCLGVGYTVLIWLLLMLFPRGFIHIFNSEPEMLEAGARAITLYFPGMFLMALQFAGQSIFVSLGKSKQAVFFSIFRKVVIVLPLTLILPHVADLGADGVFLAEPISNCIGGIACYATMYITLYRKLGK